MCVCVCVRASVCVYVHVCLHMSRFRYAYMDDCILTCRAIETSVAGYVSTSMYKKKQQQLIIVLHDCVPQCKGCTTLC